MEYGVEPELSCAGVFPMDRNALMAELLGHGNHMVVTGSTRPEDMAKGMGLMLLAMKEMLQSRPEEPKSTVADQEFGRAAMMPRAAAGTKAMARPAPSYTPPKAAVRW
jgi:hypothetical protein